MTTYVYESTQGERVERVYPMGKSPKKLKVGPRWYHRIIVPCGFSIEKVEGMHRPSAGKPFHVRNMHDIRNIEAANEHKGIKWNPDAYARDHSVPMPKEAIHD